MSLFRIVKKLGGILLVLLAIPYVLYLLSGNFDWWQVSEFYARTVLDHNAAVYTNISQITESAEPITSNAMFDVFAEPTQLCKAATSGAMTQTLSSFAPTLTDGENQKAYESITNISTVCTSATGWMEQLAATGSLSSPQLPITPETVRELNTNAVDEALLTLSSIRQFLSVMDDSLHNLDATVMPLIEANSALDFLDPEGTLKSGLHGWIKEEEQRTTFFAEIDRNRLTLLNLNRAYQLGTRMESVAIHVSDPMEDFIQAHFSLYTRILLGVIGVWLVAVVGEFIRWRFFDTSESAPGEAE